MNTQDIVQKLWSQCHVLRDDGITRRFEGRLVGWSYPPLDDTARVAKEAWRRLRELNSVRGESPAPL